MFDYIRSVIVLFLLTLSLIAPAQASARPEIVLQLGDPIRTVGAVAARAPLMACERDGQIQIWDTRTWEMRREFPRGIFALSPDGKTLAAVSSANAIQRVDTPSGTIQIRDVESGIMRLWDTDSGTLRRTIPQVLSYMRPQFSADGNLIVGDGTHDNIGTYNPTVWDARSGERRYSIPVQSGDYALSPDGRTLAVETEHGASLWDVRSGRRLRALPNDGAILGGFVFSPNGRLVVVTGDTGSWRPYPKNPHSTAHFTSLIIWDVRTGKRMFALPSKNWNVGSSLFLHDSRHLVDLYSGTRWTLSVRHPRSKQILSKHICTSSDLHALRGDTVVYLTETPRNGTKVTVLNLWTGRHRNIPKQFFGEVNQQESAFSPDGHTLALGTDLWDVTRGRLTHSLPLEQGPHQLFFLSDRRTLVMSNLDMVSLWDAHSGRLMRTFFDEPLRSSPDRIPLSRFSPNYLLSRWGGSDNNLLLSPDGRRLLRETLPADTTDVFDTASKTRTQTLQGVDHHLYDAVISPNGRLLVSSSGQQYSGTIKMWDLDSGALRATFTAQDAYSSLFAFSPDSRTLAWADHEDSSGFVVYKRIHLVNVADGQAHTLDTNLTNRINAIAFLPDSRRLAVCQTNQITLIDTISGRQEQTLPIDLQYTVPTFSSDGALVATGKGQIRRVRDGKLLATFFRLYGDSAEWIAFTPDGYYEASPGATRVLRWRVGNALYPAARFATRFHRPDRVRRALRER